MLQDLSVPVVKLALVDDHPTLLNGIAAILAEEPRFQVVGIGACASDALSLTEQLSPTVLILDLSMPGDVFEAIGTLSALPDPVRIIVFTAYADVDLAFKALDAGANAYVLKGRPSSDLLEAIDAVLAGRLFVSPEFAQTLIAATRSRPGREDIAIRIGQGVGKP